MAPNNLTVQQSHFRIAMTPCLPCSTTSIHSVICCGSILHDERDQGPKTKNVDLRKNEAKIHLACRLRGLRLCETTRVLNTRLGAGSVPYRYCEQRIGTNINTKDLARHEVAINYIAKIIQPTFKSFPFTTQPLPTTLPPSPYKPLKALRDCKFRSLITVVGDEIPYESPAAAKKFSATATIFKIATDVKRALERFWAGYKYKYKLYKTTYN
ncbi:hypothetical protein NEUTE2DRAFT_134057 [Neurospora tetrasperma FGSC 2509]|nr:hypothetical protein NEUTE2DRAFT_134057 [Neurospora tetrasperma FGSC 2509]